MWEKPAPIRAGLAQMTKGVPNNRIQKLPRYPREARPPRSLMREVGFKDMKHYIPILIIALVAGCTSYEISTVDESARTNWQMSFSRQFLAVQQEAIVIPDEFRERADPLETEVSQHGYITGYNWARSGHALHGSLAMAPHAIVGDQQLSDIWWHAERAGLSNGMDRVKAYLE